jgi:hypothetical protein
MLYGFPLGVMDSDCDIDLLDPYDPSSNVVHGQSAPEATLLSYKCCMSQLSIVVKSALVDLYSSRRDLSANDSSRLQRLFSKVRDLDKRLRTLYASLLTRLRTTDFSASTSGHGLDDAAKRTGALDGQFECHLFKLQALALKLAYENARILIHRPLLSCNIVLSSSDGEAEVRPPSVLNTGMQKCGAANIKAGVHTHLQTGLRYVCGCFCWRSSPHCGDNPLHHDKSRPSEHRVSRM